MKINISRFSSGIKKHERFFVRQKTLSFIVEFGKLHLRYRIRAAKKRNTFNIYPSCHVEYPANKRSILNDTGRAQPLLRQPLQEISYCFHFQCAHGNHSQLVAYIAVISAFVMFPSSFFFLSLRQIEALKKIIECQPSDLVQYFVLVLGTATFLIGGPHFRKRLRSFSYPVIRFQYGEDFRIDTLRSPTLRSVADTFLPSFSGMMISDEIAAIPSPIAHFSGSDFPVADSGELRPALFVGVICPHIAPHLLNFNQFVSRLDAVQYYDMTIKTSSIKGRKRVCEGIPHPAVPQCAAAPRCGR